MLAILIALLGGLWFLSQETRQTYSALTSRMSGDASGAGAANARTTTQPVETSADLPPTAKGQFADLLIALVGAGAALPVFYLTYRLFRRKSGGSEETAAAEEPVESIQLHLFRKRQDVLRARLRDREFLWRNGIKVGDLMTAETISVRPSESAEKVRKILREKGLRQVLVCDDSQNVLGAINKCEAFADAERPPGNS